MGINQKNKSWLPTVTASRELAKCECEKHCNQDKYCIFHGFERNNGYKAGGKIHTTIAADEFIEAQKKASESKVGLWADNACPTPTLKPTLKPNIVPSSRPILPTSTPYIQAPIQSSPLQQSGSWACDCSKTCPNMSSCAEAQYQLNVCGCQARDGDKDGIACDNDCQ